MCRTPRDKPEIAQSAKYVLGNHTYDVARQLLIHADGESVRLRPKSRQVLEVLLAHRGSPVSRDTLLETVWKGIYVTDDALTHCIKEIRAALDDSEKNLLQTVPKVGYTLDAAAVPQMKPSSKDAGVWWKIAIIAMPALAAAVVVLVVLSQSQSLAPNEVIEPNPVIKVQQFESLSDKIRWERLAFGLSLEIASELAVNNLLTVHSVKDSRAIGPEYDGFVLRGTLLPETDDTLHVSAQLLDAGNDNEVVWNNRWTRPLGEFFDIQNEIVAGIDSALASLWSGTINAHITKKSTRGTKDLNAYELYLRGIDEKHKFTSESYKKAESYLQEALKLDPSFSEAWTTLAVVYLNLGINAKDGADKKMFSEKRAEAALRGYELSPDNPDTLVQWSWLNAYESRWEESEQAIRMAVQNAGNDADILAVAALAGSQYAPLGDDAVEWSSRAISSRTPNPRWYKLAAGIAAFHANRYVQAKDYLENAPDMVQKFVYLAATYQKLDIPEHALASVQALKEINSDFTISGYAESVSMGPGQHKRLADLADLAGVPRNAEDLWFE